MVAGSSLANRRGVLGGAAAVLAACALPASASNRARFPKGFLWGAAISAHQSEGNDINSDTWLLENLPESIYKDSSGDACDSYHLYERDFSMARAIGLNCYRFSISWSRIEPEQGVFSSAELDHYRRMLASCRAHGLLPIISYNHFSVPRWFAMRGGWLKPDSPELFARYCERATKSLGDLIGMASPFNEANLLLFLKLFRSPQLTPADNKRNAMIAAAARATNSPEFSTMAFADPDRANPRLLEAQTKAYQAIKAGPGAFPVGVTLTTQAIEAVGNQSRAAEFETALYGDWWEAANASDFVGVQAYTRLRVDKSGIMTPPAGAELTAAGYEYYPQALGNVVRLAARKTGKPIYVTESGIGTDKDARRAAWIDASIGEVESCLAGGIDVRSYIYWFLLDNFEWTAGYGQRFGLISVDRQTFRRTLKPSAWHFAKLIASSR